MGQFREKWADVRRESVGRSARAAKATLWFDQIEDIKTVSYDSLGHIGAILEQYDYVVTVATMKATTGQLYKRLRRAEEEAHRDHRLMTGRQMLRMVLENYQTDATAKELFNITRLHELPFLGDDRLAEFLDAWLRLLGDQEEPLSERNKELCFTTRSSHLLFSRATWIITTGYLTMLPHIRMSICSSLWKRI